MGGVVITIANRLEMELNYQHWQVSNKGNKQMVSRQGIGWSIRQSSLKENGPQWNLRFQSW